MIDSGFSKVTHHSSARIASVLLQQSRRIENARAYPNPDWKGKILAGTVCRFSRFSRLETARIPRDREDRGRTEGAIYQ
jgi:hypothetical protein